ncbi:ATP-binding protein [Candidatus Desantisbacteria bacterium]|nr:ATP-binding protein [Candidatus Desantisbacteria bacterium]
MYIKRTAEDLLQKSINSQKILIIIGARQVGKTTLINYFLKDKKAIFLNLDIEVDRDRFLACATLPPIDAVRSLGNPDYIVIDEAQREPETCRIVKGWYDYRIQSKVILLGSSSLNLISQAGENLTGRNEKIFLPPFLFKEIIVSKSWYSDIYSDEQLDVNFKNQINTLLLQSMVFGNYPEVLTTDDKSKYLLNLVSDYLLKDVLQLGIIKTDGLIKRLLLLLAHQAGSEVSINELATNLGIARPTVERYIELLEQTYVIFRLPAFSNNPRKEISKNHKIFFWDTGIRNALLKEFSLNPLRSDIGLLWENWVIAEFSKQNLLNGQMKNLFFWRSKAHSEVDLIIKDGENISAYEIKWKKQNINKKAFEAQYNTKVKLIDSSSPII